MAQSKFYIYSDGNLRLSEQNMNHSQVKFAFGGQKEKYRKQPQTTTTKMLAKKKITYFTKSANPEHTFLLLYGARRMNYSIEVKISQFFNGQML